MQRTWLESTGQEMKMNLSLAIMLVAVGLGGVAAAQRSRESANFAAVCCARSASAIGDTPMKLWHLLCVTLLTFSGLAFGQAPAPMAESTPPYPLSNYFPDRGLAGGYMARVELWFQPSQLTRAVQPLSMSLAKVELIPSPGSEGASAELKQEPFITAAVRMVERIRFNEPAKERKTLRISVLFLLTPCNQMTHDPTVDYYVTVCKEALVRQSAE